MPNLKSRLKSGLWICLYFFVLGGLLDITVNMIRGLNGHYLVLLWIPVFVLVGLVLLAASMIKYLFDKVMEWSKHAVKT
jgi:uncharacterized membrane protein YczE